MWTGRPSSGRPRGERRRAARWLVPALALAALAAGACRQDMHDQPKLEPYEASEFFANGMASRQLPEGTVARGQLREDGRFYEGKEASGEFLRAVPVPLDRALLERGRERYQIYCSVCHDSVGTGQGMIVQRGFQQPPSFHEERLLAMPVGYFFDVISNGFGVMSGYAPQVPVADRWAIAAYVQVLQLSQTRELASLPGSVQEAFTQAMEHAAAADDHAGAQGGDHDGDHAGDQGGGHGENPH